MISRLAVLAGFLTAFGATGCGDDSLSAPRGIEEPLRVRGGQFFKGSFPRSGVDPKIVQVSARNGFFKPGASNLAFTGDAETTAYSVAVALDGLGSGYWVLPVGAFDPNIETGAYEFNATVDFSSEVPEGKRTLLFAAGNENQVFGAPFPLGIQFGAPLPEGKLVVSLSWDNKADLDLHIIAPSGKELDPKHPNTGTPPPKMPFPKDGVPGSGELDRDSNAACVQDGYRQEDVVWKDAPEAGVYLLRVDLFSACTEPASSFVLSVYSGGQQVLKRPGRVLDLDADGGGPGKGLFVGYFTCDGSGACW